ncbi:uncharacterized protein LOC143874112 isoform X2 [Tasmannia lanceolata]|uniref:uncharacterized protein LOC143874112 isoform X2 n=1 Tax=Tasmannia lanceolata TaxID=3420 RepID=UPI004063FC7C
MEGAEEELERRSKFLNSLIQKKKANEEQEQKECLNVRVGASDMPLAHQNRAFRCARDSLDSMPKLDTMSLALSLKKEFDSFYGPAWHCIVGTSFGSYVTHSLGGFLYFSIDKEKKASRGGPIGESLRCTERVKSSLKSQLPISMRKWKVEDKNLAMYQPNRVEVHPPYEATIVFFSARLHLFVSLEICSS